MQMRHNQCKVICMNASSREYIHILRVRPYSVIFKRLQEKLRTSDSYSLSLAVSRITTFKNFKFRYGRLIMFIYLVEI